MMGSGASSRAELPDAAESRAVLVGVWDYTRLEPLPSVANNLDALEGLLTDPQLWGLPRENCTVLSNPLTVDEVLDAVNAAATGATQALVVYFAGHGLVDERSDLYLALPDAEKGRLHRAVRYDDVRREVVSTARRCRGKVMILDCCYSGRALLGGMSGAVEVADQARIDGTYLMTAAAETKLALAPPGERFTAFTGALIGAIADGVPNGPSLLGMETLYWHVRAEMEAKRYPVPQQRARNDGKDIALARNRWGTTYSGVESTVPEDRRPSLPVGFESSMSLTPTELLGQLDDLHRAEMSPAAEQILSAVAAHRADQEVAAIVSLLRHEGRARDAQIALAGAALRDAREVIDLIEALRETDQEHEVPLMMAAAGGGPAESVAALAVLLKASGYPEALTQLLDAALAAIHATTDIIGVVAALSLAGLPDEVDQLLRRALRHLSRQEAVALADALRGAGRQEAAFRLYLEAGDVVAQRSSESVAELSAAMNLAGKAADAAQLIEAAVQVRKSPQAQLDLMEALRASGQNEAGEFVLAACASRFGVGDVLTLAAELRSRNRSDAATQLCFAAAGHHSVPETLVIVHALRAAGRPVDANRLLSSAALTRSAAEVGILLDLLDTLVDVRRIVEIVAGRPPSEIAEVLDRLVGAARDSVLAVLAQQAVDRLAGLVNFLHTSGRGEANSALMAQILSDRSAEDVVRLHVAVNSPGDAIGLFRIASALGNADLLRGLVAALSADQSINGNPIRQLIQDLPAHELPMLLEALRNAGIDDGNRTLTNFFELVDADDVAVAIGALRVAGLDDEATQLLAIACGRGAIAVLWALTAALTESGQSEEVSRLFDVLVRRRSQDDLLHLVQMLHGANMSEQAGELARTARAVKNSGN